MTSFSTIQTKKGDKNIFASRTKCLRSAYVDKEWIKDRERETETVNAIELYYGITIESDPLEAHIATD